MWQNTKRFLFSYLTLVIKRGNWKEVVRIRKKVKKLLYKESMGFVIRSRFAETLETEKSSLFYMNRENKNVAKNSLKELKIKYQLWTISVPFLIVVCKYPHQDNWMLGANVKISKNAVISNHLVARSRHPTEI